MVVKDTNGCIATAIINITEPSAISSSHSVTPPTCNNDCSGIISFGFTSGGVGTYQYSIDNGNTFQVSPFFTGQCPGTYQLIVKDNNNCEFITNNVIITNPAPITFTNISNTNSNCGLSIGSFEVLAQNGTGPYDYTINDFAATQNNGLFSTLTSGIYTLEVEDANNCIDSTQVAITNSDIQIVLDSTHLTSCFGGNDGAVYLHATTGTAPFNYTLDNTYILNTGAFDASIDINIELAAGTHFMTINDDVGCSTIFEFQIGEPDEISFTTTVINNTCSNSPIPNGSIMFNNVLGGDNGPYTFSIDSGGTYQGSNTFLMLTDGIYHSFVRDGNGCKTYQAITITQPQSIIINLNTVNLTCNGDNSGSIEAIAQNGVQQYTYTLGLSSNTTGVFNGLAAGPQTISVTDNIGCTSDTIITLTEPDDITANFIVTDNLCLGNCNGEIQINATGGTISLLYSIDNGVTQQTSNIFNGLCDGTYPVYIEDFSNCTFTINQVITAPTAVTTNLITTNATCGLNNSSIIAAGMGGTGPYNFAISSDNGNTFSIPANTNVFDNLAVGQYVIKVLDVNLCEITEDEVTVNDSEPTIDFIETTDISCNGANDGIIIITSGLGVGVHTYSINNINYVTNDTFVNLTPGPYNIYVTDGNGCVAQTNTIINEPAAFSANLASIDLNCNADSNGEISISAAGGTAPFSYSINNGLNYQSFGVYSNLQAGTYETIILDANNCVDSNDIIISEPAIISSSLLINDASCFGICDGTITLNAIGGTAPLNYQWSQNIAGTNDDLANGICSGNYNAIITDANGCTLNQFNIAVGEPAELVITNVIEVNDSCFNSCTGAIEIITTTGTSFQINGPVSLMSPNPLFENLCAGNYDIIVTDNFGCTASTTTSLSEPDVLVGSAPTDWTNVCFGSDVNIASGITVGGTQPYTYNWSDLFANAYPTNHTFNYVANQANTFTYNIVDANGCTAGPYSFSISTTNPLVANAGIDVSICPGESVDLLASATGGQPNDLGNNTFDYFYSWNTGDPNDTLTGTTVTPNITTTYTISVIDYCQDTITDDVTVVIYPDPTPVIQGGDTACTPYTSSLINANSIPNSTCEWIFSNGITLDSCNSVTLPFNSTGCYDVIVNITANGCFGSDTIDNIICINSLPIANFEYEPLQPVASDGDIQFKNLSRVSTTYEWTFEGFPSSSATHPILLYDLDEETVVKVCLEATTPFGCKDTTCQNIMIHDDLLYYVPNAFTPDDGLVNSTFTPIFTSGFDPYQYQLTIFDRWGKVMFISKDPSIGWDGTFGNFIVEQAVYIWKISYNDKLKGTNIDEMGHVTLMR